MLSGPRSVLWCVFIVFQWRSSLATGDGKRSPLDDGSGGNNGNPAMAVAERSSRNTYEDLGLFRRRRSSVFRSETCLGRNKEEGVCYGEVTCQHQNGRTAGFCKGLQGACCLFYRTCGGRTSQTISHFRNDAWPRDERLRETCFFSVTKKDSDICGLSLTLDHLKLPGRVGACADTFLWISGIPGKNLELICGKFSGITYILNVTTSSEVFIKMKSYSGFKTSWKMKVKQVPCSEFKYEVIPHRGDGATAFLAPIAAPTTTRPLTTSASAPNFARCGVKGPDDLSQRNTSSSKAAKLSVLSDLLWSAPRTRDGVWGRERSEESTETGSDDVTTSDDVITADDVTPLKGRYDVNDDVTDSVTYDLSYDWQGPQLEESLFFKYSGGHSLLGQRITYGEETELGEFPWQAALFIGKIFHCGGSVISDQHILTAAHCVARYNQFPQQLRVILGVWDVKNAANEFAQTYFVDTVTSHPDYSRFTLQNDIAVLKLKMKIDFNLRISPICLPQKDIVLDEQLAFVTGWGRDQRKKLVTKLHKLQAAIVPNDLCNQRWVASGSRTGFIVPSMLCMDSQDGDSCNGDSGGPTVVENPNQPGRYIQAGVVSFGSGSCTNKKLPGVYTKVSHYVDWIQNIMN